MQSRVRSPSSSSLSSSAGHIRQAATSLTSNAGAMAFGLGKKAYEKVGKVLGGGGSSHAGSGSGSDTSSYHHPSPVNMSPMQLYPSGQDRSHGPSAFNARRSPNSSGSWSIPSQSVGSRSSSERDGRDTPSSFSSLGSRPMGRLVRAPRAPSGLVFKRALWECVKDTKTSALSTNDPLAMRMIPALIYRCVQHMYKWGLEEEGLFRYVVIILIEKECLPSDICHVWFFVFPAKFQYTHANAFVANRISGRAGHIARLRNDFDGGMYFFFDYCSITC